MRRVAPVFLLFVLLMMAAVQLASTQLLPAFEVASVKPMTERKMFDFTMSPGQLVAVNVPLSALIQHAYGMQPFLTFGVPAWARQERFEITAKAPGQASTAQILLMLRALLTDRFKLRARMETRELPMYVLQLAEPGGTLGPGMHAASRDCSTFIVGLGGTSGPGCAIMSVKGTLTFRGRSLTKLASDLQGLVTRPIQDGTGMSGLFDVELAAPEATVPQEQIDQGPTESLFTALREQLGLRLEATRGPVEVLVVDSVERPTSN